MRRALPALSILLLVAVAQAGEESPSSAKAAPRAEANRAKGDGAPEALPAPAASKRDLELAAAMRPSVVRVRWRDARFGDLTAVRNAVVVRRDGLLLMAGPPPGPRGTLTVRFADGRELRAHALASDAETALTLLRVPTTGLVPVLFAGAAATGRLALPALASRIVMITGDGALAVGAVRSHGRHGSLLDAATRRHVRTTGLFGVALTAVDEDAGAPLLDERGRVAGLLVGRRSAIAPEDGAQAARRGLAVRPRPVEAVAVPASVVRLVWPLLERHGHVPRAGLGIETEAADATLRAHLGLRSGGHLVRRVDPAGAAARHGLALHDVIISVDGRTTPPETSLHDVLLPFRPRTEVRLGVIRAGASLEIRVLLGERGAGR